MTTGPTPEDRQAAPRRGSLTPRRPLPSRPLTSRPLPSRTGRLRLLLALWAGAAAAVGGAVALWPAPERVQAAAAPARGRVEAGERPGREGALRYNLAAGARSVTGARAASGEDDRPVAEFDERQTRALIQAGWRPAGGAEAAGAFARHAERVATLAAVARAQGYKPSVGAMQANLGTLAETAGRVAPEEWRTLTELRRAAREMRAARLPSSEVAAAEARVAALEGALAERVEAATGAPREEAGWATINLDVNADGVVDVGDLADAEREARR